MLKKILQSRQQWMQNPTKRIINKFNDLEILKMCKSCYSFKYSGNWHFEEPAYLKERDPDEEISIQFVNCPACIEEQISQYETENA